jgi:hypothetical protein
METSPNFFQRYADWLAAHRSINLLLIFSYFVFIYYMHDVVVHLSVWVMNMMSLPVYNKVVLTISILLLASFAVFMIVYFKKYGGNRLLKISYLSLTIAFIILHFRFLFEMNIEIIHIFEYSILALLIFPVTRRFGATVLFAVPLMLMDEWHQYIVLYPGFVEAFEFNDIIIDMYGCGLAMVALMICGVRGNWPVAPLWRRSEFIFLIASLVIVAVAVHTCFITLYEADKCANTWLVLNIIHGPVTFWRQFPGRPGAIYHLMQPLEAIIAIASLSIFYFGLDSFRKETVS